MTSDTGAIVSKYEYDPFGGIIGMQGADSTKYLFTGQEFDAESELYSFNARYYNPKLGRFIARDRLFGNDGDLLSRNRYIYAKNNQLKYIDPTGESPEDPQAKLAKEEGDMQIAGLGKTALDVIRGAGYAINENYSFGLSSKFQSIPDNNATKIGRVIGDTVTTLASGVEMITGGGIAAGGVIFSPIAVAGTPFTVGGSIAVDAGAIAGGSAMVAHGGSVFLYTVTKDTGGLSGAGGGGQDSSKWSTPNKNSDEFIKLKGDQGWRDAKGNIWKKDNLHKDHWDISDKKGNKINEVDFNGNELWPSGPKNKGQ